MAIVGSRYRCRDRQRRVDGRTKREHTAGFKTFSGAPTNGAAGSFRYTPRPHEPAPSPPPDLPADLGHEVPPQGSGRQRVDRTLADTWERVAKAAAAAEPKRAARALGQGLPRGHGRLRLPARRPHPRRRRHGPLGHALQLLRDGPHRGRPHLHLRERQGSRAHHAAGRRHRPRLLHAPPQGRAGEEHRRGRLGPRQLHGRVGRHVPHHHVGRRAARRHDGDACAATIPTSRPSSTPRPTPRACATSICRCW